MVIAFGSYPEGRWFEPTRRYQILWSHGQVVKTPPFHGGIRGSSPLGTTTKNEHCFCSVFLWCMPCIPNPCGFSVLSHPDRSKLLPAFAKNSPLDSFLYASPLGTTKVFSLEHLVNSVYLKTFGLSFERFITTSKCSFFTIILFTKAFIKMNFLLLMIIQPM